MLRNGRRNDLDQKEGETAGAPRIVGIELTPVHVPFRDFVLETMRAGAGGLGMAIPAEEEWTGGDFVICRLTAEDGTVGTGEVTVWLPETGVSVDQVVSIIKDALGRYVIGESPFDTARILRRMDANVARNEVAKGLLDMACHDLAARIAGRPVCELIGGMRATEIPLAALIPLTDVDIMLLIAKFFVDGGMATIRCKLGRGVEEDRFIVARMREELGDDVRIRVDYNQAYSPAEAVEAIKALEPFGIDVAEQPVAADDYAGMAYVQQRVDTPLMAHEGCFDLNDTFTLAELGAIGVVGINTERPGGLTNALRAVDFAKERGMGVVLHNQTLGIASATLIHLAAARSASLGHAVELFGQVMLEDDLIRKEIDYSGGTASVPDGPGWGVELDQEALVRYATGPAVTLG